MIPSAVRPFVLLSLLASSLLLFNACSSDDPPKGENTSDAGQSADDDDEEADDDDAKCGPVVTTSGETCVGFGEGDPCDASCGRYGYVCFGGAPPGIEGCHKVRDTAAGETYCCAKNDCVAQPDQDSMCSDSAKPHRFQCPPDSKDGNVAPPSGCKETKSGATEVEKFYCCP